MELLEKTKNLDILRLDWEEKNREMVDYPLYEKNYLSGMRIIFQQAIEREDWLEEKEKRFVVGEKRNIWSFIGRRGSGKTTAMDGFCRILNRMSLRKEKEWWLEHTMESKDVEKLWRKEFHFHILKPIDASLFGNKEDLFEVILTNIYKAFEECLKNKEMFGFKDNPLVREITTGFMEILKMYRSIGTNKDSEEYTSSILHFISGSQQIQEKISELLKNLFSLEGKEADYEYIVITIDDLDLNFSYGYEMLEQLQKYFADHKIIILVTMDYEQMLRVCEEHFCKQMSCTRNSEMNKNLANDYMMKIFHYSQRMYMLDMKKNIKNIGISVKLENKEEKIIEAKEVVFAKIAEKMHIFYDGCGLKRHFGEPENIRELVSYNEFLESLESIDYKSLTSIEKLERMKPEQREAAVLKNKEILKKYNRNQERFIQDINTRMLHNMENMGHQKTFKLLNARDLERRAKYFVNAKKIENEIIIGAIESDGEYSYGTLLQKIYEWGRKEDKNDKEKRYFEDRPFICCVLASFTSEMVREYLLYKYAVDNSKMEEDKKKHKKYLMEFMGDSFSNKWSSEAFPRVMIRTNANTYQWLYTYNNDIKVGALNIKINLEKLKEYKDNKRYDEQEKIVKNWLKQEEVITTLECLEIFFVKREDDKFRGIQYKFKIDDDIMGNENELIGNEDICNDVNIPKIDKKKKVLAITGMQDNLRFDIMGFVAKSMNYKEEAVRLHNEWSEGLTMAIGEYLGYSNNENKMKNLNKIISEEVKRTSKLYQFTEENSEYEVAFPFYNLDMSYNVYKRVRRTGKAKEVCEDFFSGSIAFFDCIKEYLNKEQEFYKDMISCNYLEQFEKSPYVSLMYEVNKNESKIPERLNLAIYNMVVSNPEEISDERDVREIKVENNTLAVHLPELEESDKTKN